MAQGIDAVFIDLDGTLVYTERTALGTGLCLSFEVGHLVDATCPDPPVV